MKYVPLRERMQTESKKRLGQLLNATRFLGERKKVYLNMLEDVSNKTCSLCQSYRDASDLALNKALDDMRVRGDPRDSEGVTDIIHKRTEELETILRSKLPRHTDVCLEREPSEILSSADDDEPYQASFPQRIIRTNTRVPMRAKRQSLMKEKARSTPDLTRGLSPYTRYVFDKRFTNGCDLFAAKGVRNEKYGIDMAEVIIKNKQRYDERMQQALRAGINYLPKGESRPTSVMSATKPSVNEYRPDVPEKAAPVWEPWEPPEESQLMKFMRRKLVAAAESLGKGARWRELFMKHDADFSGELTEAEINKAVRLDLRVPATVLTDRQIGDFVRDIDTDDSGTVSLKELIDFLEKEPVISADQTIEARIDKARSQIPEQLHLTMSRVRRRMVSAMRSARLSVKDLFGRYDTDGDGTLSFQEFDRALRRDLKLSKRDATDRDIAAVFAWLDGDNTGSIDIGELKGLIHPQRISGRNLAS
ncbi:hypothetical protein FOL47_008041 [Perkinsus chesapeaki]|uniref:EF-hand domain-containing protein n=1 Tax=Perkinsus chesapeaki TaxID=330153 RepID=A0A7J6N2X9_PERCH|nr:hypothetical protein FOL47_008041 [Perkinsus chesapeaki]